MTIKLVCVALIFVATIATGFALYRVAKSIEGLSRDITFLEEGTDEYSISKLDGVYYVAFDKDDKPSKMFEGPTLDSALGQARQYLK